MRTQAKYNYHSLASLKSDVSVECCVLLTPLKVVEPPVAVVVHDACLDGIGTSAGEYTRWRLLRCKLLSGGQGGQATHHFGIWLVLRTVRSEHGLSLSLVLPSGSDLVS